MHAKNNLTSQELQILATEMDKRKKSLAVSWILWFFLGGIGGHRYYVGKFGTAIAMTLTLGCLGVWSLIDIFFVNKITRKKNEEIESLIISEIQHLNNGNNAHLNLA
jgi:TM2 domain-containing membrane protein YozV